MPDWSPVRAFGGYAGWGDPSGTGQAAARGELAMALVAPTRQRPLPPARNGLVQEPGSTVLDRITASHSAAGFSSFALCLSRAGALRRLVLSSGPDSNSTQIKARGQRQDIDRLRRTRL